MNSSTKEKQTHTQKPDLRLPRGSGVGEGWIGRLGFDASYFIQERQTTRSHCTAQATLVNTW